MMVQLIYTDAEKNLAEKILKIIYRLVPHSNAKYIRSGRVHLQTLETDDRA